eukprot:5767087-Amphidinium_carterae.2
MEDKLATHWVCVDRCRNNSWCQGGRMSTDQELEAGIHMVDDPAFPESPPPDKPRCYYRGSENDENLSSQTCDIIICA